MKNIAINNVQIELIDSGVWLCSIKYVSQDFLTKPVRYMYAMYVMKRPMHCF